MTINLSEIYAGLEAWRDERHISVESQKEGYLVNVLEELGEISSRTGAYDEASKKWIQDTSPEARSKWYKANYELARVSND